MNDHRAGSGPRVILCAGRQESAGLAQHPPRRGGKSGKRLLQLGEKPGQETLREARWWRHVSGPGRMGRTRKGELTHRTKKIGLSPRVIRPHRQGRIPREGSIQQEVERESRLEPTSAIGFSLTSQIADPGAGRIHHHGGPELEFGPLQLISRPYPLDCISTPLPRAG